MTSAFCRPVRCGERSGSLRPVRRIRERPPPGCRGRARGLPRLDRREHVPSAPPHRQANPSPGRTSPQPTVVPRTRRTGTGTRRCRRRPGALSEHQHPARAERHDHQPPEPNGPRRGCRSPRDRPARPASPRNRRQPAASWRRTAPACSGGSRGSRRSPRRPRATRRRPAARAPRWPLHEHDMQPSRARDPHLLLGRRAVCRPHPSAKWSIHGWRSGRMTMSIEADAPWPTIDPAACRIPCRPRKSVNTSGRSSPMRVSSSHGSASPRRCQAMLRAPPPGRTRSRPT